MKTKSSANNFQIGGPKYLIVKKEKSYPSILKVHISRHKL
jgi:hypothetical protein